MYRYQILIEYVGTSFVGWQIQKKGKSVQKIIQSTLSKLLKEKIILYSAGRTDREVHANGQSAHFDVENKIQNIDKMVKSLKYINLTDVTEDDDNTDLSGELACTGGSCEITSL